MTKISVILTVYNKEKFLCRALDALLEQNDVCENDYEIIVVNDGSTDGSAIILDEYSKKDNRVRVVTQNNQGLSMARNNGMAASESDYIWFIDADDEVAKNAIHLIRGAIDQQPDIIPIWAKYEGDNQIINAVSPLAKTGKDVLIGGQWNHGGVFYVFRRDFLIENNLKFYPDIYHEDSEFTPRMLYLAKTVVVIPEVLYFYYIDQESITHVPRPKRAYDCLIVAEHLDNFVHEHGEYKSREGRSILLNASFIINNALDIIVQNDKRIQEEFERFFHKKYRTMINVLFRSSITKYRLEAILFLIFPKHCVWAYKLLKKI